MEILKFMSIPFLTTEKQSQLVTSKLKGEMETKNTDRHNKF